MAKTTFSIVVIAILAAIASVPTAVSHKCFICTPSGASRDKELMEIQRVFPGKKIGRCNEFTRAHRHHMVLTCPKDAQGCLTKFEAGTVTRTCANMAIDECKEADGVTICYCSKDRCNNPDNRLSDPVITVASQQDHRRGSHGSDDPPLIQEVPPLDLDDDEDLGVARPSMWLSGGDAVGGHQDPEDSYGEGSGAETDDEDLDYLQGGSSSYPDDDSEYPDATDSPTFTIEEVGGLGFDLGGIQELPEDIGFEDDKANEEATRPLDEPDLKVTGPPPVHISTSGGSPQSGPLFVALCTLPLIYLLGIRRDRQT